MVRTRDGATMLDDGGNISAEVGDAFTRDCNRFGLAVRDQLSELLQLVKVLSVNAEQIVAVEAKLHQMTQELYVGDIMPGSNADRLHVVPNEAASSRIHLEGGTGGDSRSIVSVGGIKGNSLLALPHTYMQPPVMTCKPTLITTSADPASVEDTHDRQFPSNGTKTSSESLQEHHSISHNTSLSNGDRSTVHEQPSGFLSKETAMTQQIAEGSLLPDFIDLEPQFSKRRPSITSHDSRTSSLTFERAVTAVKFNLRKVDAFRLRMWTLLDDPSSSRLARIIYVVMVCIIITSIPLKLMQTVDEFPIDVKVLPTVDTVFDGVFILEVVLRFCFCPSRWAFPRNGYNIIDIVSALPIAIRGARGFVVPTSQNQYTVVDFVLIIFVPPLRLLKLLRRFKYLRLLRYAVKIALEALVVPLFLLLIICLVFSGFIYVLEPRDNITSLPHAVWLVVVTVSTVGYGDTLPTTPGGYVVTTILVAAGVLYMAVPISIVGHAWHSVWSRRDEVLLMDQAREQLRIWGYTAAEMQRFFEAFDLNNDRLLDFQEFSAMLSEMHLGLSKHRVAELFDTLDVTKDGFVDEQEFAKALFPEQYYEESWRKAQASPQKGVNVRSKSKEKLRKSISDLSASFQRQISPAKRQKNEHGSPRRSPPLPSEEGPPTNIPKSTNSVSLVKP